MSITLNQDLINLVKAKSILNKDVTDLTFEAFTLIKKLLSQVEKTLKHQITDDRIKFQFSDKGAFEAELRVGEDIIIFLMYTNALVFDPGHAIYKTGYISKNTENATCGMISIYNFLSDSFKYERRNDIGFLIGRMFINKENHFFMEGKKQLGVLYNDISENIINEESILKVIEKSIQYSVDIDINVPPFDAMKEISVHDVLDFSLQATISSGKRLGFKFQNDTPPPEA
jgi:hypothetical protein